MAKNRFRANGRKLHLRVADINGSGAGNLCKSGDPGVVGIIPVVCLTDEDSDGRASTDNKGVYKLTVTPAADIGEGAELFWDNTTGTITDDATGAVHYGSLVESGGMTLAGGAREVEVRLGW